MDNISLHNNKIYRRIKSRYHELDLINSNLELIPVYNRSNIDLDRIYNTKRKILSEIQDLESLMIGKD